MASSYAFVNEYHVKPELVTEVRSVIDYAMTDLDLPRLSVTVRWYQPCTVLECLHANSTKAAGERLRAFTKDTDKPLAGMAVHNSAAWSEIWLDCRRSPAEVAMTAAHELRHVWQYRKNWRGAANVGLTRPDFEDDAEEYAEQAVEECKAATTTETVKAETLKAEQDEAARRFRYSVLAAKGARGGW